MAQEPQFETTEEEDLYERAAFGQNIEAFWSSAVGKYLRNRAQECYTDGIKKLKSVDPADTKAVQAAQNEVKVAEWFEDWLQQGIRDGLLAMGMIQGAIDEIPQV